MYFRMTNSDERRNSTEKQYTENCVMFSSSKSMYRLTDVRGTSNMLNNVFLLMYQMRRRVLSFSIYSEKVKNNMSQNAKESNHFVCYITL